MKHKTAELEGGWTEYPGGIPAIAGEWVGGDLSRVNAQLIGMLAGRLVRKCYPGIDPMEIGMDGIDVRYVETRLFYRFSLRTVEQFGQPQEPPPP